MQRTLPLYAKGFWRRSLDEFKRQAKIAINMEGVTGKASDKPLIFFDEPDSIDDAKKMSDADIGGFSSAALDFVPGSATEPPHARFHGSIDSRLPPNNPNIQRSGYAGWRTRDRRPTLFGRSLWDIDPYEYLALRIKSDGRKYFVNVQTESIVPTDLHQHRLHATTPGKWETVHLKFHQFVRTNHGLVVEPQKEMLRQKMRSVGMSLIDRVEGPFELCIAKVWATNNLEEEPGRTTERETRKAFERETKGEIESFKPPSKDGEVRPSL